MLSVRTSVRFSSLTITYIIQYLPYVHYLQYVTRILGLTRLRDYATTRTMCCVKTYLEPYYQLSNVYITKFF